MVMQPDGLGSQISVKGGAKMRTVGVFLIIIFVLAFSIYTLGAQQPQGKMRVGFWGGLVSTGPSVSAEDLEEQEIECGVFPEDKGKLGKVICCLHPINVDPGVYHVCPSLEGRSPGQISSLIMRKSVVLSHFSEKDKILKIEAVNLISGYCGSEEKTVEILARGPTESGHLIVWRK